MIANAIEAIAFYTVLSGGVSLLLILAFYLAMVSFNVYTFALERILQHMRLYNAFTAFVIYVYRGDSKAQVKSQDPKEDDE